jgi:hypothetical protein
VKSAANVADALRDAVVSDEDAWPDRVRDLIAANEAVGVFYKKPKQRKGFRTQPALGAVRPQNPAIKIERKAAE